MPKTFRPYQTKQMYLLPPSLQEWLAPAHLCYFVMDVVEQLDLSEIEKRYDGTRGAPAYHPVMMTGLLLYAYCVGVPSSRKIEKKCQEDVAFRVIAGNQQPDHDTIADFRKRHLKALASFFIKVLKLCAQAGLVKLGHVALDGTKMKANASKHKAMSYGRMVEKEKELEKQVAEMLARAEAVDEEEDRRYGEGKRGDELPEELRFRESRLKKIKEAKEALEAAAREEAKEKGTVDNEGNPLPTASGKEHKHPPGRPKDKAQRNFTDPESRIMKDSTTKGFIQGYNAQAAVDTSSMVIVGSHVTQHANDKKELQPMVKTIQKNTGKKPEILSADAGYYSEENTSLPGIDFHIPPEKKKHSTSPGASPRGRIPKGLSPADRMRRKLQTKKGKEIYGKRKETIEPVFGQTKEARGFRRFLLRGFEPVQHEWDLICITHNILKLFRSGFQVCRA